MWGDPNAYQRTVEAEERIKNRGIKGDGEQPPSPEEGDKYILVGAILGIIIGGSIGFLLGAYVFGKSAIFLSILAGIFVGGLIGTWIGSFMKNNISGNGGNNQMNAGM